MKDYHEGKAKTISGITAKDDKTVVIKYSKLSPSLLWGDGFIYSFSNAKQIEKVTDFARFWGDGINKNVHYLMDHMLSQKKFKVRA